MTDSGRIGEVRSTLAAFPGLADVAIIEHGAGFEDSGDRYLIAYVVPSEPGLDVPELHAYARAALLNGSMPAAIIVIDEIPMTAAGTMDTAALPVPNLTGLLPYQAPSTPRQELLCELFAEILGVARCGVSSDFFDLGGRSIEAMVLAGRIRSVLGVPISVADLFKACTVGDLDLRLGQLLTRGSSGLQHAVGQQPGQPIRDGDRQEPSRRVLAPGQTFAQRVEESVFGQPASRQPSLRDREHPLDERDDGNRPDLSQKTAAAGVNPPRDPRRQGQGIRQCAELPGALDQAQDESGIGGLLAWGLGAGDAVFDRAVIRRQPRARPDGAKVFQRVGHARLQPVLPSVDVPGGDGASRAKELNPRDGFLDAQDSSVS